MVSSCPGARSAAGWPNVLSSSRPLVELMAKRVVESGKINADETPVRVLDPTRDSNRQGQFWTYITPGDQGYTIYDYRDHATGTAQPRSSRISGVICRRMPTRRTNPWS